MTQKTKNAISDNMYFWSDNYIWVLITGFGH